MKGVALECVSKGEQIKGRLSAVRGRIVNWWWAMMAKRLPHVVTIDGCMFNINSPAISLDAKTYFLFGQYEKPEREALKRFLDPGMPVIEFGAAIGVVSCLTNKKLDQPRNHVVVEANPDLLPILEQNRNHNKCSFTILHRAVAYAGDKVVFFRHENYLGGSVQTGLGEPVDVPAIRLQDVLEEFNFERCSLICDIEGGESDLIKYEAEIISRKVVTLIVEFHEWVLGLDEVNKLLSRIEQLGFTVVFQQKETYVFQNTLLRQL